MTVLLQGPFLIGRRRNKAAAQNKVEAVPPAKAADYKAVQKSVQQMVGRADKLRVWLEQY
ncbi:MULTISPECIES: hypothetical protein [Paenibacillus]|uniref:Uncharacterized protein n=1 Tax=Paenibacillus illinoisensis TaxID=59845 RepID=A0A2W0CGV3_9BACL|nr:hypothetical protein [Paenibacillus illinoisensis]MBM6383207.1 hypothetical protein [Paenibacillus sp.]PAD29596.1 hypothetical protein CHH60_18545 [Paenibacillus sp. 7523-1]PYY27545.1 hypothetical protein PIL02S_04138 [Paenibacillus illinoisensis]